MTATVPGAAPWLTSIRGFMFLTASAASSGVTGPSPSTSLAGGQYGLLKSAICRFQSGTEPSPRVLAAVTMTVALRRPPGQFFVILRLPSNLCIAPPQDSLYPRAVLFENAGMDFGRAAGVTEGGHAKDFELQYSSSNRAHIQVLVAQADNFAGPRSEIVLSFLRGQPDLP